MKSPRRASMTTTPPTTPPTIAPMFDELLTGDGVGAATGVLVDIPVVMIVVDPNEYVDLVDQVNDCRKKEIKEDERNRSG
jgi:hypothetical protein